MRISAALNGSPAIVPLDWPLILRGIVRQRAGAAAG
jgi:hypothetical protein